MDLRSIASPLIQMVNSDTPAVLRISNGQTTAGTGKQTPVYLPDIPVMAQVQPLSTRDLRQIEGLNLQGIQQAMYLKGKVQGLNRPERKGGDLIVIAGGVAAGTYLVTTVLEQWPDWVKVTCTLQNGS